MFGLTGEKDTAARQQLNLMLDEMNERRMFLRVIESTLKDDPKYEKAWRDEKDRVFFNNQTKPRPLLTHLEE
jgi:hypothetical protein